jgi:hypothetical protein
MACTGIVSAVRFRWSSSNYEEEEEKQARRRRPRARVARATWARCPWQAGRRVVLPRFVCPANAWSSLVMLSRVASTTLTLGGCR